MSAGGIGLEHSTLREIPEESRIPSRKRAVDDIDSSLTLDDDDQPCVKRRRVGLISNIGCAVLNGLGKMRRGLAFVWLHYLVEPLLLSHRKAAAHRYLKKGDCPPTAYLDDAVKEASAKPFHSRLPARPRDFVSPPRPSPLAEVQKSLPAKRKALLQALRANGSNNSGSRRKLSKGDSLFRRVPLKVDRQAVFDSAIESLLGVEPHWLKGGVSVRFYTNDEPELGVDSGGLTREFLDLAMHDIVAKSEFSLESSNSSRSASSSKSQRRTSFGRRRANSIDGWGQPMFKEQADRALMLIPSPRPPAIYNGLGLLIGVATLHASRGEATLSFCLNNCLLKYMVGAPITADDVRTRDPEYYKNRIEALMTPGGIEAMAEVLGVDRLVFAEGDAELKPGGANVPVTPENVEEYVAALSEEYACGTVRSELAQFLTGFHSIIPKSTLAQCGISAAEFGLLLSGVPELDVAAWSAKSELRPAGVLEAESKEVASWFFDILKAWEPEERAKVLAFVTGCSRLPAAGFGGLTPPFTVEVIPASSRDSVVHTAPLPMAHTCTNVITIPCYSSKALLAQKLALAVNEGSKSFGLR